MSSIEEQQLRTLRDLARLAGADVPLDRALQTALEAVLTTPGLPIRPEGAIFLIESDPPTLAMKAHKGLPLARANEWGRALRRQADPSRSTGGDGSVSLHGAHVISLKFGKRSFGSMSFSLLDMGRCNTQRHQDFLQTAADIVAGMIEQKRLEKHTRQRLHESRRLAAGLIRTQEEKYRQLARELHDELGQSLVALKANAKIIARRTQFRSKTVHESARAIVSIVDHIYDLMHSMVQQLRPAALDDLGLVAALETLINDWHAQHPWLPCRLELSADLDGLGEITNIAIYRIVQECLTNVLRHTAASKINITLARSRAENGPMPSRGDHVTLAVEDDGQGMDVRKAILPGEQFGLFGIRERIEGLGGELLIESKTNRGVRISANIPIAICRPHRAT